MCYQDTISQLTALVARLVKFKSPARALEVAQGRCLPLSHDITRCVYEEAERLLGVLSSNDEGRAILDCIGTPGYECRGTKLSAIREAIYACAESMSETTKKKAVREQRVSALSQVNVLRFAPTSA